MDLCNSNLCCSKVQPKKIVTQKRVWCGVRSINCFLQKVYAVDTCCFSTCCLLLSYMQVRCRQDSLSFWATHRCIVSEYCPLWAYSLPGKVRCVLPIRSLRVPWKARSSPVRNPLRREYFWLGIERAKWIKKIHEGCFCNRPWRMGRMRIYREQWYVRLD